VSWCPACEADADKAERERDALRKLVAELAEEVDEAWGYASDYFRDKWRDDELIARARAALGGGRNG
jgi:hypothetical protein